MGWSEHHSAGKLDSFGAYLPDQEWALVEAIHGHGRRRFKVGKGRDQLAVVKQHPLMSMMGFEISLHAVEGGDVRFQICHRSSSAIIEARRAWGVSPPRRR